MIERSIATTTHGRYLVVPPTIDGPAPLLVGFHGYAELAEAQLERMRAIPGAHRWRLVSIQGLNRFYNRRSNDVIAGWMTRQDRGLAIADNLLYTAAVVDTVLREWPAPRVVYAGFSQGVAMTFRAAAAAGRAVDGLIAVGGDVPPEIAVGALSRIPSVLVCHGARDDWYTQEKFDADLARVSAAGCRTEAVQFDGGHEWSAPVLEAASRFLVERSA